MAISRDTFAVADIQNTNSQTISYTNAGNVIIVFVWHDNTATHNGATWNGASMTYIGTASGGAGAARKLDSYIIETATTGTHNIVSNITSSSNMETWAVSYLGVKAGQPDGHDEPTFTTGTSASSTIIVTGSGSWVVGMGFMAQGSTASAGTGVLTRLAIDPSTDSALFDSNGVVGTGSQAYGYTTGTSSNDIGLIGVSISPTVSSGTLSTRKALLGVGI